MITLKLIGLVMGAGMLASFASDEFGSVLFFDLPLKFHPVAIRVSVDVTPFGAG